MNEIKTVGRPKKYVSEDQKKEVRRHQNKVNQQRCRRLKKLHKELELLSENDLNKSYRSKLVDYINQYDFDYFFTGTYKKGERDRISALNQEIKQFNLDNDTDFSYISQRKIGINSLRNYAEKYLTHLCNKGLIQRCFIVYEQDLAKNFHVHILFKSAKDAYDFKRLSTNNWLLGFSKCKFLKSHRSKEIRVNYMVKELNCYSMNKNNLQKIDSWNCHGDYEIQDSTKN